MMVLYAVLVLTLAQHLGSGFEIPSFANFPGVSNNNAPKIGQTHTVFTSENDVNFQAPQSDAIANNLPTADVTSGTNGGSTSSQDSGGPPESLGTFNPFKGSSSDPFAKSSSAYSSSTDFGVSFKTKYMSSHAMKNESCKEECQRLSDCVVALFCPKEEKIKIASFCPDGPEGDCIKSSPHSSSEVNGTCHFFKESEQDEFPTDKTFGDSCKVAVYNSKCRGEYADRPYAWEEARNSDGMTTRKLVESGVRIDYNCRDNYELSKEGAENYVICDKEGEYTPSENFCKRKDTSNTGVVSVGNINTLGAAGGFGAVGASADANIVVSSNINAPGGIITRPDPTTTPPPFLFYNCTPITLSFETGKKVPKKKWVEDDYCHYYTLEYFQTNNPVMYCVGSNYNDQNDKRGHFWEEIKKEDRLGGSCGDLCSNILPRFKKELGQFAAALATLNCYYYSHFSFPNPFYYQTGYLTWYNSAYGKSLPIPYF